MPRMGPPPYPNRIEHPYEGSLNFQGILIYVENAPGSTRSGTDDDGNSWSVLMSCYYGEIPGTNGPDGDPVDVFVGPHDDSEAVFVIHQPILGDTEEPGYDEDKVMLGFESKDAAESAYQRHYDMDVDIRGISEMTVSDLKEKMDEGELDLGAAVTKAMPPKPSGSGWVPVLHPRGGRKGWRRLKSGGGYEYRYPVDQKRRTKRALERTSAATRQELEDELDRLRPTTSGTLNPKTGKYEYSDEHYRRAALYKFVRIAALDRDLDHLTSALENELSGSMPTRENATAAVLLVMLLSGMRPGGKTPGKPGRTIDKKTKKPVDTFGASTIQARHAKVRRDGTVVLDFVGKSGVKRHVEIKNKSLARAVRMFKRNAQPDRPLFSFESRGAVRPVSRRHQSARLKEYNSHYLSKDLRTRVGTQVATAEVARIVEETHDLPKGDKQRKTYAQKLVRRVAVAASDQLGNEPAVALAKYVDPDIVEHMLNEVGVHTEKSDRSYRTLRWVFGDEFVDKWVAAYTDDSDEDDVEKAMGIGVFVKAKKKAGPRPPGSGWQAIPGGRRGGYRRRKGKSWEYWYPGQASPGRATYEADPTKRTGTGDIDPGALIHVGGRTGLYRWVPDHGTTPGGTTWVQSVTSGSFERVRSNTVQPVRKKAPARPKKKRASGGSGKPRSRTRTAKPKPTKKRPSRPRTPSKQGAPPKPRTPRRKAQKAEVYEGSTATKGTVLYDLEHGEYTLREIVDIEGKRRYGVHVPPERQSDLVREMRPAIESAARKVAKRFGIRVRDEQGITPAYEELVAGAHVGFVMALSNYRGGSAFAPMAQSFATLYAQQAAKTELGAGIPITDRSMRLMGRFFAARAQARKKYRTMDPTPQQIADTMVVRKKDLYTGATNTIGTYPVTETREVVRVKAGWRLAGRNPNQIYRNKTAAKAAAKDKGIEYVPIRFSGGWRVKGRPEIYDRKSDAVANQEVTTHVNQANEDLPNGSWRLRDSEGNEVGPEYPGKLATVKAMAEMGALGDVNIDTWMIEHPGDVYGSGAVHTASQAHAVQHQIDEVMSKLQPRTRRLVELAFGVGTSTGEPATLDEIASKMRIARGKSRPTKRRKAKEALESAMRVFRALADDKQREVTRISRHIESTIRPGEDPPPPPVKRGPSHFDLKERFGSDEGVHLYHAAVRGGFADHAEATLSKEKEGTATDAEKRELRERVAKFRDGERLRTFMRLYDATPVDPEDVSSWGPQEGSSPGGPTSITFHTEYMTALAKRGLDLLERHRKRGN